MAVDGVLVPVRLVLAAIVHLNVAVVTLASGNPPEHRDQSIDVFLSVVSAQADPDHAWPSRSIAVQILALPASLIGPPKSQQPGHVRLRAETSASHADAAFVAQDGGDEPVGLRAQVERNHADAVGVRP